MDQNQFLESTRQKMHKALEVIKADVATIRTGRATASIVDHVLVDAYDGTTQMKLSEMATITANDARTLLITPFDPTQIAAIEKSINKANVGLTPVVDSQIIRLTVPALTEERREEYIKLAKAKIEGGRVMVRQIRHDVFSQIKHAFEQDEVNEDARDHLEKQVQDVTDATIKEIDLLFKRKEDELRQI